MDVTRAGTAIMIAIAAALWFAYFVPTWMRRREYLDTERTATRLQQTLRVMAETAELPDQVRVEVSARDATRHERLLRAERRRALELEAKAISGLRRDASADARLGRPVMVAKVRRRRAHRFASALMIAATITIVVQLWLIITDGAVLGSWFVLAGGVTFGIAGVSVRRRLDARGARQAVAGPPVVAASVSRAAEAPVGRASGWTPIPLPAPLYLSHPESQPVTPATDLVAQLRAASQDSERAVRAAHEAPEVVPFRPQRPTTPDRTAAPVESPAMRSAPASRWASMGRVEGMDAAAPDLDEALRRRRNVG